MPALSLTRALVAAAILAIAAGAPSYAQAPEKVRSQAREQVIPGRYIVVYKDSVADPDEESDRKLRKVGGRKVHAFKRVLKGFAGALSDEAVRRLREDPDVDFIEADQVVTALGVDNQAPWGLDRIDQADRPLDTQYHYDHTGAGVYAFIIDTGIRADHEAFAGRVRAGFTAIADGHGTNDCDGHGTHVAGTVGGTVHGVAKAVTMVPVRVLDCEGFGTWSGVIAGLDWVAAQTNLRPAVANMSLGGGKSAAINAAVARAVSAGVVVVVAAGNENTNACNTSPASEPTAITVGATTSSDARASYSNYGSCVDLFAPGSNIVSAWNTSTSALASLNGTSMASPHVAGVAALALEASPAASPAAISNFIVANATPGRLASLGSGSPNRLLYSMGAGAPVEVAVAPMAVRSLSGGRSRAAGGWAAKLTVAIRNLNTGAAVAGATVSASFAPGGSGQCVTGTRGDCTITSAAIPQSTSTTVATVTGVTAPGLAYDASQNSATQVTIKR